MAHIWKIFVIITLTAVFSLNPAVFSASEKTVEDVIDIHMGDKELIAVKQGETVSKINLQLRETILWKGSDGYVGAAITNERLLAVSRSSSGWIELPFRLSEAYEETPPDVLLSDRLVLLATDKRLIGFDSDSNRWATVDLPLHEELVKTAIDSHVGIGVTTGRAYGLAKGVGTFVEKRFNENEEILSVETSAFSATIRTSRRLLIFKSSGAYWREIDVN